MSAGTPFAIEYNKEESSYTMADKHEHAHYEIYYLISGERFYFIEDQIYHVHQGDLVFISKGFIHRTSEVSSSTCSHERIIVYFTEKFLHPILPVNKVTELIQCFNHKIKVIHLNTSQQNFIEALLTKLMLEKENKYANAELYQKMLLIELLIFCNRLDFKNSKSYLQELNPIYNTVHKIIRYIRNNYHEKLTLSSIAKQFYISPYYLSRMFKQITGLTLIEYINNTRIKAAQKLLLETNNSISEIAAQVGYESHTHFGRMFKKIVGVSPMKYRKNNEA